VLPDPGWDWYVGFGVCATAGPLLACYDIALSFDLDLLNLLIEPPAFFLPPSTKEEHDQWLPMAKN